MNGLALCAGVGGLELGLAIAIPEYRTVCYVEREAYAAAVLSSRMADKALDEAPVWDDLLTFKGTGWRGCVDLVSAGFPCQPFSSAGRQRGIEDERWLWSDILRIIREVEPVFIFFENVPGLRRHGLPIILRDLSDAGFDAEWDVFSAAEVGAPHLRKRLYLLAHAEDKSYRGRENRELDEKVSGRESINSTVGDRGTDAADADQQHGDDSGHGAGSFLRRKWEASSLSRCFCHADCQGCEDAEKCGTNAGQSGIGAAGCASLQSFVGNGIRNDWWATEPELGRVAHGVADRVDRLRAIGNGVVPAVAAKAWSVLYSRLMQAKQ